MSNLGDLSLKRRTQAVLQIGLLACLAFSLSVPSGAQAGRLDPSFGTAGIFTSNFGGPNTTINAVALQTDNKIVVGGAPEVTKGEPIPTSS